jgi:hypothetical protein
MANTFNDAGMTLNADGNYFVLHNSLVSPGYGCHPEFNSQNVEVCQGTVSRQSDESVPKSDPCGIQTKPTGFALGNNFLTNLQNGVNTFIAVTQWDHIIWSSSIALGFTNDYGYADANGNPEICPSPFTSVVTTATRYDPTIRTGLSLAGAMEIFYTSSNVPKATVAMPTAYPSGHTVVFRIAAGTINLGHAYWVG